MGIHDDYGKELLRESLGTRWDAHSSQRSIELAGVRADLDGVIISKDGTHVECAVEIEARVYKQIRGAIVDLALHPAPSKLLIVMLAQPQVGKDEDKMISHIKHVWTRIHGMGEFSVVCLKGTGTSSRKQEDRKLIVDAIRTLGILPG